TQVSEGASSAPRRTASPRTSAMNNPACRMSLPCLLEPVFQDHNLFGPDQHHVAILRENVVTVVVLPEHFQRRALAHVPEFHLLLAPNHEEARAPRVDDLPQACGRIDAR